MENKKGNLNSIILFVFLIFVSIFVLTPIVYGKTIDHNKKNIDIESGVEETSVGENNTTTIKEEIVTIIQDSEEIQTTQAISLTQNTTMSTTEAATKVVTTKPKETTSSTKKEEITKNSASYPLTYSDSSCSIVVDKIWFEDAWCYVAKLKFTDYSRFGTAPANGMHMNGLETTSHFANRYGAIFAVNGDYACPDTGNTAIRSGIVYTDKNCKTPAVYNAHTGIFNSPSNLGIEGELFSTLVKEKKVTDSFTFWSWVVVKNGKVVKFDDTSRAQRTTIGSNGNPGEIIIVVSEGRYADGKSAGLTFNQCGRLMKELGCITAVPLDGGGSSTMYFNGKILNSVKGNERAIRDFVYFK